MAESVGLRGRRQRHSCPRGPSAGAPSRSERGLRRDGECACPPECECVCVCVCVCMCRYNDKCTCIHVYKCTHSSSPDSHGIITGVHLEKLSRGGQKWNVVKVCFNCAAHAGGGGLGRKFRI